MSIISLFSNNILLLILSINLIPIILIFFLIPITILRRYQSSLIIFLSFTTGGLMTDVFLRLLPHIILSYNDSLVDSKNQSHVHHQFDSRVGLFPLTGIFLLIIIEKLFRYFQNGEEYVDSSNVLAYLFLLTNVSYHYTNSVILSTVLSRKSNVIITKKAIHAIMHIFYGYAILIYSGWTSIKAMRYLLLTGLTSSILCFLSLQFQSNTIAQLWSNQIFLSVIAGMFVYISTAHLMPELMSSHRGFKGTIYKVLSGILSGWFIFHLNNYD